MTSQTPEQIQAETDELDDQLIDALGEALSESGDADYIADRLAPALAAIRRHAAADALREQADRIGKRAQADHQRAADADGDYMRGMYRNYAEQGRTDARLLRTAADDVIAEGWTNTCAQTTPATREDPGYGCETPVENEGDYCPRHEPADDDDPRGEL